MSRIARDNPDRPEQWDAPRLVGEGLFVHIDTYRPRPPRCACSHPQSSHGTDRQDRPTCFFAVCACTEFREDNR